MNQHRKKRLKCLSVTETEEDFMTNTDTLTEDLLRKDVERTVEEAKTEERENENGENPTETEIKLAQVAAAFLGKQMEC